MAHGATRKLRPQVKEDQSAPNKYTSLNCGQSLPSILENYNLLYGLCAVPFAHSGAVSAPELADERNGILRLSAPADLFSSHPCPGIHFKEPLSTFIRRNYITVEVESNKRSTFVSRSRFTSTTRRYPAFSFAEIRGTSGGDASLARLSAGQSQWSAFSAPTSAGNVQRNGA